ncbi:uncharacterized protein At4g04775-like [Raphanus sativus]|uniref:Uncharacterized protein At4g04775-like n=1 Tax=Raphanus sativus TaxID=3726 RepID=A0A6J0LND7_RAPSA|nr:uncharacterized protein At4g04775-like [Raphanus sativus]
MSSSSSSNRQSNSQRTVGIPTRCWCGANLTTYGAQTKENKFRRFYRCVVALQRKNEQHLFKWIDEAIIDEIDKVDGKCTRLYADLEDVKRSIDKRLDLQDRYIQDLTATLSDFRTSSGVNPNNDMMEASDELRPTNTQSALLNIAGAAIALLTMTWVYSKLSN